MSLLVQLQWEFPLNSVEFHNAFKPIIAPGVYEGLAVTASATTLSLDVAPGLAILPNGVIAKNDSTVFNAEAVRPNSSGQTRKDVLVIEYTHGGDPAVNRPRFLVIEGTPGAAEPTPGANQVAIAVIVVPDAATSITNVDVHPAPKISRFLPAGFRIQRSFYNSTSGHYEDEVYENRVEPEGHPRLSMSLDVISAWNNIPGSVAIMAARLALEGIYPGNFSLVHNSGSLTSNGQPTETTITIDDVDPATVVTVNSSYDDNLRLSQQVFVTEHFTLTVTYDYSSGAILPDVTQVVTHV